MDPYHLLQEILPDFIFDLPPADIWSYVENGFVTRRFVLHGRFPTFGHTRTMRTYEETLLDSFLKDYVPQNKSDAIYQGDAVGGKISLIGSAV
jgi:hypothetical protein